MTAEMVIAEMVQKWSQSVAPGDDACARAAVRFAVESYAGGASVAEACEEARKMVMARLRHPSSKSWRRFPLPAAS